MPGETERLERAGRYVLGMMDDAERERAERDLEFDPKFRAAVVGVAERMHLFDLGDAAKAPEANWGAVAAKIADLPHMRETPLRLVENAANGDKERATGVAPPPKDVTRIAAHSVPNRQAVVLVIAIAAAFAVGYAAGIWSVAP